MAIDIPHTAPTLSAVGIPDPALAGDTPLPRYFACQNTTRADSSCAILPCYSLVIYYWPQTHKCFLMVGLPSTESKKGNYSVYRPMKVAIEVKVQRSPVYLISQSCSSLLFNVHETDINDSKIWFKESINQEQSHSVPSKINTSLSPWRLVSDYIGKSPAMCLHS